MAESNRSERGPLPASLLRDRAIERWAQRQIDRLIDPDTPPEERERRIHRLTEGPLEFVNVRRDLPRGRSGH